MWRSVAPLIFSTSMTGVTGGLMKRKATMERRRIAAKIEKNRHARQSQGCFFRLMLRFRVRSPETA